MVDDLRRIQNPVQQWAGKQFGDECERTEAFFRVLVQDLTIIPNNTSNLEYIKMGFNEWRNYLNGTIPPSAPPVPQLRAMIEPNIITASWLPESLQYLTQTDE
jgi:hypothetical protein